MRRILQTITCAGGLWLGLAAGAGAQDAMNAFGGFPTETGAGLPYTTYAPRTNYGTEAAYNTYGPYTNYGATAISPGLTTYNSGYAGSYAGYLPRSYSPSYSYPTGYTYGYAYPYPRYSTYTYPVNGYYTYSYYPATTYRRGLFGWRAR